MSELRNHQAARACVLHRPAAASASSGSPTRSSPRSSPTTTRSRWRPPSIGLQLPERADVKIRGVHRGRGARHATAERRRRRARARPLPRARSTTIPANVTARILPKTLFGEKYVALQVPDDPARRRSRPATPSSRPWWRSRSSRCSTTSTRCCAPSSRPSSTYTLTALATALEGRGEQLGENLETLDGYLKRLNPQHPRARSRTCG